MKILFTGGGTGGHFYPIIAVAEKLNKMLEREKIAHVELFYMSTEPYNERLLYDNKIQFKKITAGKLRAYFSLLNIRDLFITAWGIIKTICTMFFLYPDVVFGKGGYASFPVLVAARFFRIPVIIHESDTVPGRVNTWAGKFATKIAISYPEAAQYFPHDRIALTGNPMREEVLSVTGKDAIRELNLEPGIPVILVLGGSQGAQIINEVMITLSPQLVEHYQIIHQTGETHMRATEVTVDGLIGNNPHGSRYHVYGYLNSLTMKMAAEVATIVISRAGSAIFEIAAWGVPAILIPIANHIGDHQRKNAFAYARAGGGSVIEELNFKPSLLLEEINNLITDEPKRLVMKKAAQEFTRGDAAEKISRELIAIVLKHKLN